MTDHLPECDWGSPLMKAYSDILFGTGFPCQMCKALRACEQRVADDIWGAIREGSQYKSGFEGGLDAARDAVAALANKTEHPWASIGDAIAAIDALRGEPND